MTFFLDSFGIVTRFYDRHICGQKFIDYVTGRGFLAWRVLNSIDTFNQLVTNFDKFPTNLCPKSDSVG